MSVSVDYVPVLTSPIEEEMDVTLIPSHAADMSVPIDVAVDVSTHISLILERVAVSSISPASELVQIVPSSASVVSDPVFLSASANSVLSSAVDVEFVVPLFCYSSFSGNFLLFIISIRSLFFFLIFL